MTSSDKERIERCIRVQKYRLEKKQPFVIRESILRNISDLERELTEPITEELNTGDNFKTNNPFI